MTKSQAISIEVLSLIENGMNAVDALKQVCGADAVDAMIGDLYDALRAKS